MQLPNLIEMSLMALAILRIGLLFSVEDGPFGIFEKTRNFLDKPNILLFWIKSGLECVWCNSVWFSGGLVALYYLNKDVALIISLWLSLSMVPILIKENLIEI